MSPPEAVAVILAAGKGTRMESRQPKVLFPLLGRALVSRVLDAARQAGCSEQIVVVGFGADMVRAELGEKVLYAVQEGMQGTGQAVVAARETSDFRNRTVVILPGDVPLISSGSLQQLLRSHQSSGATVTVMTMEPDDATGYGRIIRGADSEHVVRIVEHRDANPEELAVRESNTSIYAVSGSFLFGEDGLSGALAQLTTDNDQCEYLLTDIVAIATKEGEPVHAFILPDPSEVAGINDRTQLAALESDLKATINEDWMRKGVSMDNPQDTRIEEGVTLARDVVLGASVELRGSCRIANGARVGRGCVLIDVSIGEGATLEPYVVATSVDIEAGARVRSFTVMSGRNEKNPEDSNEADRVSVGANSQVGPFTHLRQSSQLGVNARAGNFVEMKKTRLGEGAKANHLAYLGDADVGDRSNIGAGVITCNYDGFAKHKTIIGDEVFVGTDSHLVAPVRLGKGAYVATGTTVTRDVPADALAIGRTRQENKAGYAARLKSQLERRSARAKAKAKGDESEGN
jgi:bifunctional UDP-N-acetylglucosamine pyrophosphorylase / glucosamine-1-phosphate N-acetyltransferase